MRQQSAPYSASLGHTVANIFLIGPMGSGKTTIGQRLALELGLTFYDCDHELEERTGASVNLIFDVEGEDGFRERETRLLDELTQMKNVLIATGGGVVTREESHKLLKTRGLVVYLETSVDQQLRRLSRDSKRPLLQTPDRKERLTNLANIRNPLYQGLADLIVTSHDQSVPLMAKTVLEKILEYQQQQCV